MSLTKQGKGIFIGKTMPKIPMFKSQLKSQNYVSLI